MGICELLTIVFVVLKLTGVITWSWWLVLLPEIIAVGLYILWSLFAGIFVGSAYKKAKKEFDTDFFK